MGYVIVRLAECHERNTCEVSYSEILPSKPCDYFYHVFESNRGDMLATWCLCREVRFIDFVEHENS